jgi:hypothetical protein
VVKKQQLSWTDKAETTDYADSFCHKSAGHDPAAGGFCRAKAVWNHPGLDCGNVLSL